MNTAMVQITADKISKLTGFTPEEVAIIKNTVAKKVTDTELAYFLNISKSVNLNPFNKEIWCYKDNKDNLLVFSGRDGFLKKAQESQLWNGITSFEVCENDKFELDVPNNKISHVPNFKDRGKIIGAYAIVKPKGCELATIEWAEFKVYNKGKFTWSTHPADMIKKVAETHALKKAFGITVLQSEYDYKIVNSHVESIETAKTEIETVIDNLLWELDAYAGDDKEVLKQMCADKVKANEFDMPFAKSIADKIGVQL
jgi:phage recombination protein Bet